MFNHNNSGKTAFSNDFLGGGGRVGEKLINSTSRLEVLGTDWCTGYFLSAWTFRSAPQITVAVGNPNKSQKSLNHINNNVCINWFSCCSQRCINYWICGCDSGLGGIWYRPVTPVPLFVWALIVARRLIIW